MPKSFSQDFNVRVYNEEDGLLNSTVYDIQQDSIGRMWFATRVGISVYDGIVWKSYTTKDGLTNSYIKNLIIDDYGIVWAIPYFPKVTINYFKDNKWQTLDLQFDYDKTFEIVDVQVQYIKGQLTIILGSLKRGVFVFSNGDWKHIENIGSVRKVEYCNNKFFIVTDLGIKIYDNGNVSDFDLTKYNLSSSSLTSIKFESSNNENVFWIADEKWISKISNNSIQYKIQSPGNLYVKGSKTFLCPDNFGGIYFGNIHCFYYYNSLQSKLKSIDKSSGLVSDGVNDVFIDRENIVWTSNNRGLNKIVYQQFENYNNSSGLLDNEVTSIVETKSGNIIFGHALGLTEYKDGNFTKIPFMGECKGNSFLCRILDMDIDDNDEVWMAASQKGIGKLDKNNRLVFYPVSDKNVKDFSSVLVDKGNVYALHSNGLLKLKDGVFEPIVNEIGTFNGHKRKIVKGPGNIFYIATNKSGLLKVDNEKVTQILISKDYESNNIFTLFFDSKGKAWVGAQNGVYLMEEDKIIKHSKINISRPVYLIFEDCIGDMWFGTNHGVYRFTKKGEFEYFDNNDGFAGHEVNRDAGICDSKGNVWIGCDLGVSKFSDNERHKTIINTHPEIYFDGLIYDSNQINKFNQISLKSYQNNLEFKFSSISFINESKNKYVVFLEGFDKSWSEPFAQNHIRYNNLKPGNYKFYVKGINAVGNYSHEYSTGIITIRKAFIDTIFFKIGLVLIIVLVFLVVFQSIMQKRTARILEKEIHFRTKELKEANQTKDKFFTILAHDLISPFNSVRGLVDIMVDDFGSISDLEKKEILLAIQKTTNNTYSLVETLLNWIRTQTDKIDFKPTTQNLNLFVEKMQNLYSNALEKKSIKMSHSIPNDFTVFADANMLETILRNLISNSIKFTPIGGEISVSCSQNIDYTIISVKDSGVGMDENTLDNLFKIDNQSKTYGTEYEMGTGLGLILCKEFVEIHKGEIIVKSKVNKGSEFEIHLPKKHKMIQLKQVDNI